MFELGAEEGALLDVTFEDAAAAGAVDGAVTVAGDRVLVEVAFEDAAGARAEAGAGVGSEGGQDCMILKTSSLNTSYSMHLDP